MNTTGGGIDPRVRRSRTAIIDATGDLLTDTGLASITADTVAASANVSKATLYRHWSSLEDLLDDTIRTITASARPHTATDSIDDALAGLIHYANDPTVVAAHETLLHLARRSPRFRQLRAEIHELTTAELTKSIELAIGRHELSAEIPIDQHLATLLGPVVYQALHPRRSDINTP
jgi:AcrR family transcriptional regulator